MVSSVVAFVVIAQLGAALEPPCGTAPRTDWIDCSGALIERRRYDQGEMLNCAEKAGRYVQEMQRWRSCRYEELHREYLQKVRIMSDTVDRQIDNASEFRYCITARRNPACPVQ